MLIIRFLAVEAHSLIIRLREVILIWHLTHILELIKLHVSTRIIAASLALPVATVTTISPICVPILLLTLPLITVYEGDVVIRF